MYPGGKGCSFQQIINRIPPHRVYIEAFLGGGSVMKRKRPARFNVGLDLNPIALVATAQEIVPGTRVAFGVAAAAAKLAVPDLASAKPAGLPALSPGASVRTSTPPTVAGRPGGRPSPETAGLERWLFCCADAVEFLEAYPWTGGEFVYCDPPYLMETRRSGRAIYEFEYSTADHVRLLDCLLGLPCDVMLSGYWSALYADRLHGWTTATYTAQTRGGEPAEEWLWMNYPEPAALHDYRYLGDNYRERERIKRKKRRWVCKLHRMDPLERRAILWAVQEAGLTS